MLRLVFSTPWPQYPSTAGCVEGVCACWEAAGVGNADFVSPSPPLTPLRIAMVPTDSSSWLRHRGDSSKTPWLPGQGCLPLEAGEELLLICGV